LRPFGSNRTSRSWTFDSQTARVEACRQVCAEAPDSKVMILTSCAEEDALYAVVMAGAASYILKDLDTRKLADALVTVPRAARCWIRR
jgi:DNA-binding NarL/FixJ family response regulator